jgi:hypothetical protein
MILLAAGIIMLIAYLASRRASWDLGFLSFREFEAAALSELVRRVPPLLDQRMKDTNDLVVGEFLTVLDLLVGDGGLGHAQRCEPNGLFLAHGLDHFGLNPLVQGHGFRGTDRLDVQFHVPV